LFVVSWNPDEWSNLIEIPSFFGVQLSSVMKRTKAAAC
jgi:hypothetical protein